MHTDVESGGTSVFDRRRPVFLDQGKHSQDAANTGLCLLLIDQLTELADPGSGVFGPSQELCCTQRHFLGAVLVPEDRERTRLNSSHGYISYAGLCFKKKHQQTLPCLLAY